MLTRVTITGADDDVDPVDLHCLSAEFPFVEWAILRSARAGRSRYPSAEWLGALAASLEGRPPIRLAAHLCGVFARDALVGSTTFVDAVLFQRHQINGFALPAAAFFEMASQTQTEFILQVRSESDLFPVVAGVTACSVLGGRFSLLFDPSGGRGVEAVRWPTPLVGVSMGYAGGIKPTTVEAVLRDIGPVDGDFWIDMESGVRVDDRFDLALVREVLSRAAPFVSRSR